MMKAILFASMFYYLTCVCFGQQTCTPVRGYEGCACQISGSENTIGLDALVTNDTQTRIPRFVTKDNINWDFGFYPCRNFDMFTNSSKPGSKSCKGATAVRFDGKASTDECFDLGASSSAAFEFVKDEKVANFTGLTVTYRNPTTKAGAKIFLKCNESLTLEDSKFTYLNVTESVLETYYFQLESRCCCPGLCSVTPKPTPKPSVAVLSYPVNGLMIAVVIGAFMLSRF